MKHQFAIIGNGSWSSALVKILTDNGHTVHWWMRSEVAIHHLQTFHHNPHYLKSVYFNMNLIHLYSNIETCINESDILLIGIPSAFIVDTISHLPKTVFQQK